MTAVRARRVEVPRELDAGDAGAQPSYASAFELPTADAHALTAEQWARATFEGAPALLRWFMCKGWALALGLRLEPRPSPGYVLGWLICDPDASSITLRARSRLLAARNTVLVKDAGVVWVTVVDFKRPIARPIWGITAPIHHVVIPYLLKRASLSSPRIGHAAR